MNFKNQVAVITGAGSGIGREVALHFAQKGASVVVADVNMDSAEQTVRMIVADGGDAIASKTDVRIPSDVIQLMDLTVEKYQKIDILVNNAGVSRWKSVYDLTVEEWDDILNINLRGYFLCAREAAKHMRKNAHGGSIINMASTRAYMSEKNSEAYAASKGGVIALTHALAVSLGDDRIRVNSISPGWIETGDYDSLREIDHAQHPAQRVGKTEDIARACLYLADPLNDFVTGTNITVDGGMTRKMIYEE